MIGKMDRREIADRLGVSLSSLKRAFRSQRLAFHNYCAINPWLVKSVCKFYETHSKQETAKHFGLKEKQVDHMVYRYRLNRPKQIRWTNEQIIEAAKMAGLISPRAQAKYFNRPNAFSGSIKSLWNKRFNMGQGCINGMTHWTAKEMVNHKARYLLPKGEGRAGRTCEFRRLILWVDMEKVLKPGTPDFVKSAVMTMANFQRWLWRSDNPRPLILKMIKEREA